MAETRRLKVFAMSVLVRIDHANKVRDALPNLDEMSKMPGVIGVAFEMRDAEEVMKEARE